MSEDYNALRLELFEKLSEMEAAVKEAEYVGIKLPPPVANDVRYAGLHYIEADKKLSQGNEEGAVKEMQDALKHMCRASLDVLNFRFLFSLKFAGAVIAELEEHKKLASQSILNYDECSKNLSEIINRAESRKLPDDASQEAQLVYKKEIEKIQAFLSDFEESKEKIFLAIDGGSKN